MIHTPKEFYGRTIYVSNHAASFMDPLVAAGLRRPIVFFMTRSDVFTSITKPILWAAHMFPIYRQHDGEDTKAKNEEVFKKCTKVLSFGRNLLIFGEGFTDDVFIRRLKPVKKGAARIGFTALEQLNWEKKIYMAAVGVNYSDPNKMRSEVLISTSNKFCLNDYKEAYLANPNKVITDVTKRIEDLMQAQITHIDKKELAPFHENIMKLTRQGMSPEVSDTSIELEKRWKYSQELAHWLNGQNLEGNEALNSLKDDLSSYFNLLKKFKLEEYYIGRIERGEQSTLKEVMMMILLFPFALLGLLHCGLPYLLIKRFVEKSFKRKVFWGSVKLLMGKIIIGLVNLPVIWLFHAYIYPSYWLGFAYYAAIGLFGLAAYMWFVNYKRIMTFKKLKDVNTEKFILKRNELIKRIKALIPVA